MYAKHVSRYHGGVLSQYVHIGYNTQARIINPRRAFAARVTVLGLCVCVCVRRSIFAPHAITR